jgi:hypothetical protein
MRAIYSTTRTQFLLSRDQLNKTLLAPCSVVIEAQQFCKSAPLLGPRHKFVSIKQVPSRRHLIGTGKHFSFEFLATGDSHGNLRTRRRMLKKGAIFSADLYPIL